MADKSPDAFRTISEVADWLGVQPHVLRFWESKFSQVKPVKRAGGRRYYRPNDMLLLGGIRKLLHEDGLTIKGAQKVLREEGMAHVAAMSRPLEEDVEEVSAVTEPTEAPFVDAPSEEPPSVAAFEAPTEAPPEETPDPIPEITPEAAEAMAGTEPVADAPVPSDVEPVPEPAPVSLATDGSALPDPIGEASAEPVAESPVAVEEDGAEHTTIIHTDPEPLDNTPVHATGSAPAFEDFEASAAPNSDAVDAPHQDELFPETATQEAGDTDTDNASPEPDAVPTAFDAPEPADTPEPDAEISPEPDVQSAKPRIVDAPDPDESTLTAEPAALSRVFGMAGLAPSARAQVTPLVAQLAALRDRMAAAREQ